jgi:hypothetical protein
VGHPKSVEAWNKNYVKKAGSGLNDCLLSLTAQPGVLR